MAELLHITSRYLGQEATFNPRLPNRPSIDEDRTVERVPVCSTVDECLAAITALKAPPVGYLYRLKGSPRSFGVDYDSPMRLVPDWEQSNEIWLTRPAPFVFQYAISIDATLEAIGWRRLDPSEQERLLAEIVG